MRIAYLTGRTWRNKPLPLNQLPGPEQDDFELLAAACAALGMHFEVAYWDDPGLVSRGFDALLIRSCWDYVDRPAEFIAALQVFEAAGLKVLNPAHVVAWNARKTYLRDLAQAGVPTIETVWLDRVDAPAVAKAFDALDTAELVIKPQVGSGSRDTVRLKRNTWSEADLIDGPREAGMAQPFLPSLESDGEVSLFTCAGTLTHGILKMPPAGDWRANLIDCVITPLLPTSAQVALAQAALAAAPAGLAYARIDLVAGSGGWKVIELELIEPRLYFSFAPSGAVPFALALKCVLSG
ncbi:MAG: ATP-grasp domain-containing protein [Caulobacterales bacterium]|jgi:glutathione synthase/RimK-type ligase-like ATP-grasp enzyme